MTGYLADTSVFVAQEQGRPLGPPPAGDARVSVATLTELGVGVRRAEASPCGEGGRPRSPARAASSPFPTTSRSPSGSPICWRARATAGRRAGVMDAIIAATALVHDLTVWTQDDDFAVLAELAPELRVHRT